MEKNLPPDVCSFIALTAQYRDAEKEYFQMQVSGQTITAADQLSIMSKVINLGTRLDSALQTILPRPTENK